jgi:hypothetical protein
MAAHGKPCAGPRQTREAPFAKTAAIYGFNELVNGWHADHIYRHQPQAVECFLLLAFLAYNLFHAFFARNLKPQLRRGRTMAFLVELIAAELYVLPRFSRITAPP